MIAPIERLCGGQAGIDVDEQLVEAIARLSQHRGTSTGNHPALGERNRFRRLPRPIDGMNDTGKLAGPDGIAQLR
jgi:hypothetical protein